MAATIRTGGEERERGREADPGRRVVVGIAGTAASVPALVQAQVEARLVGARLEVVWAWTARDLPGSVDLDDDAWRATHVGACVDLALGRPVDEPVDVTARAVTGTAGPTLVEAAEGADLLVVGAGSSAQPAGLRLGAVTTYAIEHAPVPVMVVHGPGDGRVGEAPVVVGVDGSDPSRRALRWALAEAEARRVRVVVVHGWEAPSTTLVGPVPTSRHAAQLREDASRRLIEGELTRVSDTAPTVRREVVPADHHGAQAILATSEAVGAGVAVVGCRGRGSVTRHLLGSVSARVVSRSTVPVVVLR